MTRPSHISRGRARLPGLPRTPREALSSLQVLATLRGQGWHRSVSGGWPRTASGEPWPWLTYPAVDWLGQVLTKWTRVFEYGAGASTAWFDRQVREIVAVEHDRTWFNKLTQPHNGRILLRPVESDWWHGGESTPYVQALSDGTPWDVIVVDGTARTACARVAAHHVAPTGLIILDDTDRAASLSAQHELSRNELGRLDFWGFKPGIGTRACTTVFSHDLNPWLRTAAHSGWCVDA